MNANYSALTRAGNHFIDWNSTDPPRSRGRRVRPLLWMAALFVVTASVTVAGQTETQHGTKLVGTGTEGPSEQGWSVALVGRRQHRHRGWDCRQEAHRGGLDLHTQQRHLEPTRQQAGGHRRGRTSRTRRLRRAVCRWQDRDGGWTSMVRLLHWGGVGL